MRLEGAMAWRKLCQELIFHPRADRGAPAGAGGSKQGGAAGWCWVLPRVRLGNHWVPGPPWPPCPALLCSMLPPALQNSAHPGIGRFLS